jgi:F0F1-type ATP synthase epsilon subunit
MKLTIITSSTREEQSISWIELNTPTGNIVIQEKHAPCILELTPNEQILFQLTTGKQKSITIQYGFAHILRDKITIIIP